MLAKGHVQPHHDNVPRRRQRTQSPLKASSQVKSKSSSVAPRSDAQARTTQSPFTRATGDLTNSGSTVSSTTTEEDRRERPSPGTLLTSPSDESLPNNNKDLLNTEKHASSPPRNHVASCDGEPASPFGILPPPNLPITLPSLATSKAHAISISSQQPRVAVDGARGHLEPRAANVPRRLNHTQKERERVRQRHFQELITGSGVWIAFSPKCDEGDFDHNDDGGELSIEEEKERDWMWSPESRFGFSGVIRVKVGSSHGECRRKAVAKSRSGDEDESEEEMHLVIGRQQAKACDDSGISALTDSQLEAAASFLLEHRRRRNGSGKVLITVPPSRPAEPLSIALFALSLPSSSTDTSTSSSFFNSHQSSSYLSQLRLLPGITQLAQSQDIYVDNVTNLGSGCPGTECQESGNPRHTLIQLALWHLHDLVIPAGERSNEESGGLTLEWRGALSLEGIERLENLVLSR